MPTDTSGHPFWVSDTCPGAALHASGDRKPYKAHFLFKTPPAGTVRARRRTTTAPLTYPTTAVSPPSGPPPTRASFIRTPHTCSSPSPCTPHLLHPPPPSSPLPPPPPSSHSPQGTITFQALIKKGPANHGFFYYPMKEYVAPFACTLSHAPSHLSPVVSPVISPVVSPVSLNPLSPVFPPSASPRNTYTPQPGIVRGASFRLHPRDHCLDASRTGQVVHGTLQRDGGRRLCLRHGRNQRRWRDIAGGRQAAPRQQGKKLPDLPAGTFRLRQGFARDVRLLYTRTHGPRTRDTHAGFLVCERTCRSVRFPSHPFHCFSHTCRDPSIASAPSDVASLPLRRPWSLSHSPSLPPALSPHARASPPTLYPSTPLPLHPSTPPPTLRPSTPPPLCFSLQSHQRRHLLLPRHRVPGLQCRHRPVVVHRVQHGRAAHVPVQKRDAGYRRARSPLGSSG